MAKKVKFTTTLDPQTIEQLSEMSVKLQRPANSFIDFIVQNFYVRSWPRRYQRYLARRKVELENILENSDANRAGQI
jgi:hypothetical protein